MAYLCLFNVSLGFWLWRVLSSPPRNKDTLGWNQSTVPSLIPWLSVKVQSLHWYLVKTYRSDVYSGWGDVVYYQQLQSVDFLSRPLLPVGPLHERVIVWSMILNIPCDSKFNQFRKSKDIVCDGDVSCFPILPFAEATPEHAMLLSWIILKVDSSLISFLLNDSSTKLKLIEIETDLNWTDWI